MNSLLSIKDVESGYGTSQVLFGISLTIHAGEFVTLIGRNGMGKSTTIKCLMGMLPLKKGSMQFGDTSTAGLPPFKIARLGIGLVPEMRQIFPNLTVRENLVATAREAQSDIASQWDLKKVYQLFPRLQEREKNLGANLSGGEQQMLAIGRALMTNPRLLILDEATEGLAPIIREEIWHCLAELKKTGLAILVVDKHIEPLLRLGDQHSIIEKGRVVWHGNSSALAAQPELLHKYVGV